MPHIIHSHAPGTHFSGFAGGVFVEEYKNTAKTASICKKNAKSLQVSEKVSIFAASIHQIDYPVSFRVGAGPYRHRPVLKSCFGGSLFIIPLYKRLEEVAALNRCSFQKYRLVAFEHKYFHSVWVDFEIFLDATRQRNGTIIGCHVQKNVSCLADGFQIAQGLSGLNGTKVVSFRHISKCLDGNLLIIYEKRLIKNS